MMVFVVILLLGLAFAWKKGTLEWVKPKVEQFRDVIARPLSQNVA